MTEKHYDEALKLEYLIEKGKKLIPEGGEFEVEVRYGDTFLGYIDWLDREKGVIYDFKYSNHVDRYKESRQLHLYKFYAELVLKVEIKKMCFMMFPKIQIRQRKTENRFQFTERLKKELEKAEVTLVEIPYEFDKVGEYLKLCGEAQSAKEFPKHETGLCAWCEYKELCKQGEDFMVLPSNERRSIEGSNKKRIWIYGQPFSGKTYLADKFPSPLMLNTDGNIKYVTAPYIAIKNEVTSTGRITQTKLAWEVFKDAIAELEKGGNGFKTIVVDLVEDLYEHCRLYMYKQMDITHESDDAFKAWDKVRTEFLSTMKRLMMLDYDNIVLISHEDSTKDITKRSGDKITSVKPNIADKVATKIAGMVDIVVRCVVIDGERLLTFKSDEVVFGGGRLNLTVNEIPNDYNELMKVYEDGMPTATPKAEEPKKVETPVAEPEKIEEATPVADEAPVARTRTRRTRS